MLISLFYPKLNSKSLTVTHTARNGTLKCTIVAQEKTMPSRVSQKNQKSEFWYATNPSGFHRLDEPPKKISAL